MTLAIETRGLSRSFAGVRAVDSLDLRVECGTFYGFLGPNGAGKSTTIKMLTGLLAPSAGQIHVLGRNVLDAAEALDAVTSRVVRDILARYVARGSTVFLTSHVLEVVEKLCTHVGVIVRGKLVEQDSMESIRAAGSLEDGFLKVAVAEGIGWGGLPSSFPYQCWRLSWRSTGKS